MFFIILIIGMIIDRYNSNKLPLEQTNDLSVEQNDNTAPNVEAANIPAHECNCDYNKRYINLDNTEFQIECDPNTDIKEHINELKQIISTYKDNIMWDSASHVTAAYTKISFKKFLREMHYCM